MIRIIIEYGGEVNQPDSLGQTPLDLIKEYPSRNINQIRRLKEVFQIVIPDIDNVV